MFEIDILPGLVNNTVKPDNHGVIPVALIGKKFDVSNVDVDTLLFGPDEAQPEDQLQFMDVNMDGIMDLVVEFRTQATGLSCADESAMLTGKLQNGQRIVATDSIVLLGCGVVPEMPDWDLQ